jgi:hypothetical protein
VTKPGHVRTFYGDIPGCPICKVIPLTKAHICEHGVTPPPSCEISVMVKLGRASYEWLVYGTQP